MDFNLGDADIMEDHTGVGTAFSLAATMLNLSVSGTCHAHSKRYGADRFDLRDLSLT